MVAMVVVVEVDGGESDSGGSRGSTVEAMMMEVLLEMVWLVAEVVGSVLVLEMGRGCGGDGRGS